MNTTKSDQRFFSNNHPNKNPNNNPNKHEGKNIFSWAEAIECHDGCVEYEVNLPKQMQEKIDILLDDEWDHYELLDKNDIYTGDIFQ